MNWVSDLSLSNLKEPSDFFLKGNTVLLFPEENEQGFM